MAAETSQVRANPSSEEPKIKHWLIDIMKKKAEPEGGQSKPRIQMVDKTLRESESNKGCFDPLVVSFGPYHHLSFPEMESYKRVAASWFISRAAATGNEQGHTKTDSDAQDVYDKFFAKVTTDQSSPRDLYTKKFQYFDEEELVKMMFLDGCFILHFIDLVVNGPKDDDELSKMGKHLNRPLIIRDMFLLENQIPYSVLEHLMSLMPEGDERNLKRSIEEFISMVIIPPPCKPHYGVINFFMELLRLVLPKDYFDCWYPSRPRPSFFGDPFEVVKEVLWAGTPAHLLGLLHSQHKGREASKHLTSRESGYWHRYFPSIRVLKATGILVRRNNTAFWGDITFKKGHINSHIEIPQIMLDESTKTCLLNLVACEMCPDGVLDRSVISFICFLNSIIHNEEDVKELRSKNILINRLGSDKKVVKLFKDMATNLSPDYIYYSDVIKGIENHGKRNFIHVRV